MGNARIRLKSYLPLIGKMRKTRLCNQMVDFCYVVWLGSMKEMVLRTCARCWSDPLLWSGWLSSLSAKTPQSYITSDDMHYDYNIFQILQVLKSMFNNATL